MSIQDSVHILLTQVGEMYAVQSSGTHQAACAMAIPLADSYR
jgi:hypothetical protein